MISVVLFVFLFASCFLGKQSYSGYQVLRVFFNQTSYQTVSDLASEQNLDVWATSRREGWTDLMVPPQYIKSWTKDSSFTYQVQFSDVQDLLNSHKRENMRARMAARFSAKQKRGEDRKSKNTSLLAFNFDFFPTVGEVRQWLDVQIAANNNVASLVVVGKTYNDADIVGVSIHAGNPPIAKQVYYMHCTIHAREWISTTSCLWIIDQLLNKDPERTKLQSMYHWIIVPILNVDGYSYTHTASNGRLWRKNRQPNAGTTCAGTDCNRNYAYGWGGVGADKNACGETYRGASAFSSPESRAENDFLQKYVNEGNLAVYMDIHSYGGWLLSSWGYTDTLPSDYPEMDRVMKATAAAIKSVNGRTYIYGPSGETLYPTSGSTTDQTYGNFGVVNSYTIECFGNSFTPPVTYIVPIGREVYAGIKEIAMRA